MEDRDQIGPALPIVCPRHPEQARLISKPGEIPLYAPVGGCTLPCGARLACGHICPSVVRMPLHRELLDVADPSSSATLPWTTIAARCVPLLAVGRRARGSIPVPSVAQMSAAIASSPCTMFFYFAVM